METIPKSGRMNGRRVWAAAALLLAAHLFLTVSASWNKSATFDETIHLVSGYAFWAKKDYRLGPDVLVAPDRIAAFPLLFMDVKDLPDDSPGWIEANPVKAGRQFLYELGNDAVSMMRAARASLAVFGLLAGVLVFAWSRMLFGDAGGLLSLALFAFSPAVIAHGGLVTTDRTVSFFFLFSMFALHRVVYRLSWPNLILAGAALGGLMVSKVSGVLVIPMGLIWAVLRLFDPAPLVVSLFGSRREVRGRAALALGMGGTAVFLALAAWLVVWGAYGFRYSTFNVPESAPGRPAFQWEPELAKLTPAARAAVEFARERRLLPETFLHSYTYQTGNARLRSAYLAGNYSVDGWPWFFPFCFAVKNPIALFFIILLAVMGLWRRSPGFFAAAPLLVLFGFYWLTAVLTPLNIGERHVLPTYLPLFVLAGAAASLAAVRGRKHKSVLALLLVAYAVESVSVWPHCLAFFNRAAGGPENGHRLLVDSSLDWGQDLPGLSAWLSERKINDSPTTPVHLSYFGSAYPWYHGIRVRLLPSYEALYDEAKREPQELSPGIYCVSATQLVQLYQGLIGRWCLDFESEYQRLLPIARAFMETSGDAPGREKWYSENGGRERVSKELVLFEKLRMARLCAFLRKQKAHDSVGHSIFIYRLGAKELDEALYGPPAELYPDRGVKGLVLTTQGNGK